MSLFGPWPLMDLGGLRPSTPFDRRTRHRGWRHLLHRRCGQSLPGGGHLAEWVKDADPAKKINIYIYIYIDAFLQIREDIGA